MALLVSYFKTRSMALLPPLFLPVFAGVFFLFDLPAHAVLYAAALCLVCYAALLAVSFSRFARRHALLVRLAACADVCAEHLPAPRGAIEADYQALLRALAHERDALLQSTQARYDERIGYYTLWAHQIKTPIAAMRLQLSGQETPEARALLHELMRIEQYVEMALCFLRLDSRQTDYVFTRCTLEPLVRACVKKYASQFIQKRIRLTLQPLDEQALTDEKWLSFVIEQLLSNALKYTPAGGTVTIGAAPGPVLFIEDTGIGVAREDLPRIFECGFTGQNGRQDKRASGIGLYLCRRITENLGHAIRCSSEVGRGTRVEIDLRSHALKTE